MSAVRQESRRPAAGVLGVKVVNSYVAAAAGVIAQETGSPVRRSDLTIGPRAYATL